MSGLKGIEISDVLGLSQPITKLIETVSGGIGKLYEPVHIKKIAKAKAEEIKLISDAMEECSVIPTQYNDGNLLLNNTDWNEFVKRTQGRLAFQELQKQNNIECVISQAYNILENAEFCSREPVEQGWITRFFDSVADVSDEDLQKLWGKVLAGEIKQPKLYSLRTLETLKNLSKYEAELFQKIVPYIVNTSGNLFLPSDTEILQKYNILYGEIMRLDECGLINSGGLISLNPTISDTKHIALHNNSKIAFIQGLNTNEEKISIGEYGLTRAGKELFSIMDETSNDEYFNDLVEKIAKTNSKKVHIIIHQINYVERDKINYDDMILCEFPAKLEETSK